MISSRPAGLAILIVLSALRQADAACMTLDREVTPGPFETIYICRNTLTKPVYTIVRHYVGDDSFNMFNFDPMGANIVCTDYELAGRKLAECRKAGLRPIASNYKLKKAKLETRLLSAMNRAQRDSLYQTRTLFAYPDTAEAIDLEQCFVHIAEDRGITLGYSRENYMALSTCLIRFEGYLKRNKKFLLSLY
jgi:hypothetical protein